MDEFSVIAKYLAPLAGPEGLGLLDDVALYKPPHGYDLVLTMDTMVEGVHFPQGRYGGDTAEKLLRVNLSDLAAKGARPVGYLLSLGWPRNVPQDDFMAGFTAGLKDVQDSYDFTLFGGDTVGIDGPMTLSATCLGLVPTGKMVPRNGARVGDDIWVSGTIGDAYLGLQLATGQAITPKPSGQAIWDWEQAYYRPEPRLLLRKILRDYATACADVSDGLVSDMGHIARASDCVMEILSGDVPLSPSTRAWCDAQADAKQAWMTLVTAGDDYELCFTANANNSEIIQRKALSLGVEVTKIGTVRAGHAKVSCLDRDGKPITFTRGGFTHF